MWFVGFMLCAARAELDYGMDFLYAYRRTDTEPNYNESFFSALENYEVNSTNVTTDKYPWIASVVHSAEVGYPYVCTAACVEDKVFITAARCLHSLKVYYSSVIYQKTFFPVTAFVSPSNKSKQAFDDIGFIVVNDYEYKGPWPTVQLISTNRTDDNFNWFADLIPEDNWDHVVVGFATQKALKNVYINKNGQYQLKELRVVVNINICPEILIFNKLIKGFHVPCYHSCSVKEFNNKDTKCSSYHGVLGSAVFNTKSNELLGIATWGGSLAEFELPVGFSVPNSKNFFLDFKCARRINQDNGNHFIEGFYQGLCEDIK